MCCDSLAMQSNLRLLSSRARQGSWALKVEGEVGKRLSLIKSGTGQGRACTVVVRARENDFFELTANGFLKLYYTSGTPSQPALFIFYRTCEEINNPSVFPTLEPHDSANATVFRFLIHVTVGRPCSSCLLFTSLPLSFIVTVTVFPCSKKDFLVLFVVLASVYKHMYIFCAYTRTHAYRLGIKMLM